jgi:hypothetical protein
MGLSAGATPTRAREVMTDKIAAAYTGEKQSVGVDEPQGCGLFRI